MIVDPVYNFGENLRRIRMSRGLTQTELGLGTGIPQNRISNWECGYHKPSLDDLRTLCAFLGCFPGDFLGIRSAEPSDFESKMLSGLRDLDDDGKYVMEATLEVQLKVHPKSDG